MADQLRSSPLPSAAGAAGSLLAGATCPLRALGLLNRNRQLWPYVLIPILVNLVVGGLLYAGLFSTGLRAIEGVVAGLPDWMAAIGVGVLLQALLIVGLLLGIGFLLLQFGVTLGSPWYGKLSEQLEQQLTGRTLPSHYAGVGGVLRDLGRALLFEVKKLALLFGIGLPLLLLNLLPVAGTLLATAGGIALGATIACLDFFDPPLERRSLRFRAKLGMIRRSLPASAGFGLVCLGLVSIPFINLLAIPLCITAGTLFFCEQIQRTLEADGRPRG